MNCQSQYLFVYGTLLNEQNEFGNYLQNNCEFIGNGKFQGILFDIGDFPGAIENLEEELWVHGKVYELKNFEMVIPILDTFEGFGEGEEIPNLFIRKLIKIILPDKALICWTYIYNRPTNGFRKILSGIYKV